MLLIYTATKRVFRGRQVWVVKLVSYLALHAPKLTYSGDIEYLLEAGDIADIIFCGIIVSHGKLSMLLMWL